GSEGGFLRKLNLSIRLKTIVADVIAVPAMTPKIIALFICQSGIKKYPFLMYIMNDAPAPKIKQSCIQKTQE
ncbi:hypothetical protein, partial [Rosenbergiella nectarea]|uniref:hypothetical protein n=1 Tax=Rosenbergiella nectarea TaxID=988801 RepID=UPI001F4D9724